MIKQKKLTQSIKNLNNAELVTRITAHQIFTNLRNWPIQQGTVSSRDYIRVEAIPKLTKLLGADLQRKLSVLLNRDAQSSKCVCFTSMVANSNSY